MLLYILSIVRFLLTITRPYSYKFIDILWKILFGKNKMLPPVDDKILLMSATDLAEQIRKRKLSAEQVMKVYISRVKQVEPIINACVDERFEAALAEARDVDKMLQAGDVTERQLEKDTPLLGVPFSCKEKIGVRGLAQTDGLLFLKDRKASSDAKVVTELRKAGAIPFVATNVPTICLWWETSNLVFGRTVNPYDNRRTVGGSTGGEGALLASCGSVIGTGSDIAGSIRIPSAFCGVYGHKPTRGAVNFASQIQGYDLKGDDNLLYQSIHTELACTGTCQPVTINFRNDNPLYGNPKCKGPPNCWWHGPLIVSERPWARQITYKCKRK